ncbi:peptide-methionine (S)-S-oxide reductase, partial [Chloroflexi bacterium TSY]|nr:peptide-methionine (S)-S-oxide reductase [Chloroflexi bacterium TSY]
AEVVIAEINDAGIWNGPIVTEVTRTEPFYPAENYHQDYFVRNPYQPYCQVIIAPKVAKLRKEFIEKLKVPA